MGGEYFLSLSSAGGLRFGAVLTGVDVVTRVGRMANLGGRRMEVILAFVLRSLSIRDTAS